jgi:F-type H+-transporting ATPase subunit delta
MRDEILVKRYTEGLAAALKTEEEYRTVSRELGEFTCLLESHELLRQALLRPFLPTSKKTEIVREISRAHPYQEKTERLLLLLLQHKRLEIMAEIVRDLPAAWMERLGIVSFEVRSVVPLKDEQKRRLEEELAGLEQKTVHCGYAIDPDILGGLYILKKNVAYDISLKGQLEKLKDIIEKG